MESSFDDLQLVADDDELSGSMRSESEPGQNDGWEILSAIFIECLPPYSAAPASARAPLLLGAICRDWRDIAISTPGLWNSFILSVDLVKTRDDDCSIVRLFERWLARGGNTPLTMVINCVRSGFPDEHELALPASFVSALSRCSSRWHDVNLMLPLADFHRLRADSGLPRLRRLAVMAAVHTPSVESTLPSLNLFKDAPMLHDVSLGDGFDLANIVLPWHQLTHFDSRGRDFALDARHLDVLRQASRLEEDEEWSL
ncbi:hypothetical protein DFH06DRAFT_1258905 [Mycena polygramma]|nr:hypothetical protein DFH06DRAFT_1258905 [Mycena polygramma]